MDIIIRHMNQAQEEVMTKVFTTAYFVLKTEKPFTAFPSLLELQEINGLDVGINYRNDMACRR